MKPQLSAINPAQEWAAEMRRLFEGATAPEHLANVVTRWMSPANAKRLAHCKKYEPDLAKEIAAEYANLQARLKR